MQIDYEEQYHRVESAHWWFVGRRHLIASLVRGASPHPASSILDIGCSGGATLRHLRDAGYTSVIGIDVSAEAIAQCRRNGMQNVYVMDAGAPDFPAGSFDVVVASDILEHLADPETAIRAWLQLLRPAGVLIAFVPAFMLLWSPHDEANHHRRRYRLGELRACLEAGGFRAERSSYWNVLLMAPALLIRTLQRLIPPLGHSHLDMRIPPALINSALATLLRWENRLFLAGISWPWGLSALVVARRPNPETAQRS